MEEKHETFTYTYSAAQQEELKRIREKYAAPTEEEDKMECLRRLDRNVTKPGMIAALIVGIISALVMGIGMCCTMVWGTTSAHSSSQSFWNQQELLTSPARLASVCPAICCETCDAIRILQKQRRESFDKMLEH